MLIVDDLLVWLTNNFNLCKSLSDVSKLKDLLEDIYINMAETNYPYPTDFLTHLPANPVKVDFFN